ncbi:hypothetical protein VW29_01715, partial [Devosia limi DSM 17137]
MSNGLTGAAVMRASQTTILERRRSVYYPLADAAGSEGVAAFLAIALKAEALYEAALAAEPGLRFEDHLEPMLAAAGRCQHRLQMVLEPQARLCCQRRFIERLGLERNGEKRRYPLAPRRVGQRVIDGPPPFQDRGLGGAHHGRSGEAIAHGGRARERYEQGRR